MSALNRAPGLFRDDRLGGVDSHHKIRQVLGHVGKPVRHASWNNDHVSRFDRANVIRFGHCAGEPQPDSFAVVFIVCGPRACGAPSSRPWPFSPSPR